MSCYCFTRLEVSVILCNITYNTRPGITSALAPVVEPTINSPLVNTPTCEVFVNCGRTGSTVESSESRLHKVCMRLQHQVILLCGVQMYHIHTTTNTIIINQTHRCKLDRFGVSPRCSSCNCSCNFTLNITQSLVVLLVIVNTLPFATNDVLDESRFNKSPFATPLALLSSRTDTIKSLFDLHWASFESVIINAPPPVEFTTNCLRKVTDVTDVLALLSVFSVLILFFLSFLRRRFLFWSCSATRFQLQAQLLLQQRNATETARVSSSVMDATILSPTPILITSPTRSSERNLVPKPDTVVPEPWVETVPLKENVESRTYRE